MFVIPLLFYFVNNISILFGLVTVILTVNVLVTEIVSLKCTQTHNFDHISLLVFSLFFILIQFNVKKYL